MLLITGSHTAWQSTVCGYFSGKGLYHHLIGEVLRTDKLELRCATYYSMLGDSLQNMGDYDPPLNVLSFELHSFIVATHLPIFTCYLSPISSPTTSPRLAVH